MNSPKHNFIARHSTSVLIVCAIFAFIFVIIYLFDKNLDSKKIVMAISTGGLLIVTGDLLRSPFILSWNLYREYEDLIATYSKTTNIISQIIAKNKMPEAIKESSLRLSNARAEKLMFDIGNILTVLGFSCFLLVLTYEKFYELVSSMDPLIILISFILLMVSMILKEHSENSLEKVTLEKEEFVETTKMFENDSVNKNREE
jgi:hypothetical protein